MFRHPQLDTPRGRALQSFSNFFLHVYPVKIPTRVLRLRYSFRLGFIAAVLFGILTLTGVYLMFVYTPSPTAAYGDMQHLKTGVGFGQLIRNVHRWSAHLMVLVVALHLVRVFYAGAYKRPREFNWVIGVVLLLAHARVLVHGLPVAVGPAQLLGGHRRHEPRALRARIGSTLQDLLIGGDQIGPNTLLRFYALHVAVLPGLLIVMLAVHIWRVRKDGFAVERPSVGRVRGGSHEPRRRRTRRPSCTATGLGCSAWSTASRSPPRTDRSTTRCSPGPTCSCATSSSASGSPPSCWASGWRSRRRSGDWPTRT